MDNKHIRDVFSGRYFLLILFFLLCCNVLSFGQESLNDYYKYPLSVGISYQPLSALALVQQKSTINEISLRIRIPLPFFPVLQPFVFGGLISSDSDERDQPIILGGQLNADAVMPDFNEQEVWDHQNIFAALGVEYSHRVSKQFEVGADTFFGFSQSYFSNRVVTMTGEWYPVGDLNMIAGLSGKITLNPSYNLSIDINPSIRYVRSFGNLHVFDGFYFGAGFSAHYRFGNDPDAPQREIRSIKFNDIAMPSIFAAMQSFYAKNPIGTVTITNTDKQSINDVQVFFYQAGFMDSPTPAKSIGIMESGETIQVPLLASYNKEVFAVEGITPLVGEVIVTYISSDQPVEQQQPVSYDLYDRTSMTWDDDAKIAAFITPADSALRNYTSFIRQTCKEETIPLYNAPLQFALQTYLALTEIGILYQVDPTLPFTEVQNNTMVVDSISLPRDTLKRITGDCDDLTVLFCSLLETVGIESGFITVPGHIYAVFNTKEPATEYRTIHPERNMTITLNGDLWIPVEITMIGRKGFLNAWRTGIEEWRAYEEQPEKRGFYITRKEQIKYRPVGLRETDLGLQYGDRADIISEFNNEMDLLIDQVVKEYVNTAEERERKKDWNKLGIVYAQFHRYSMANHAFEQALEKDPDYITARINQANVLYLQETYEQALTAYEKALYSIEQREQSSTVMMTKLLINISRTNYQLAQYDDAKNYYSRAEELDPKATEEFAYLAAASSSSGDTGRASEEQDLRYEVLFIEEEE